MEGKLIKKITGSYKLEFQGNLIASSDEDMNRDLGIGKLSLKNCQAIERGYDLDELAEKVCPDVISSAHSAYKAGFQKALEILGDNKFSEEDVHQALHLMNNRVPVPIEGEALDIIAKIEKQRNDIIQSLQQTEWDVEIKMICPHPEDTYVCGIQHGCDEDGCNHPNKSFIFDGSGSLILKRI